MTCGQLFEVRQLDALDDVVPGTLLDRVDGDLEIVDAGDDDDRDLLADDDELLEDLDPVHVREAPSRAERSSRPRPRRSGRDIPAPWPRGRPQIPPSSETGR